MSVSGAFGLLREAATSMPSKNRDSLDSVYIELEYREACSKLTPTYLPAPQAGGGAPLVSIPQLPNCHSLPQALVIL
jgi:hypothetical protein